MLLFKKIGLRITLFNKIFFSIIVSFTIFSLISVTLFTRQRTRALENSLIEDHKHHALIASINIESGYLTHYWPFATLKKIRKIKEVVYWRIINQNGEIYLADDAKMWGKRISDPALRTEKVLIKDQIFPETGEKIKVIVNPLNIVENGNWTFWLGFSLKSVIEARRSIILTNVVMIAIAIIFVGLLSWYLAKGITIPVRHLVDGTKAVSSGKLDYKIPIETRDEIGELAISFNKMTENLKTSQDELVTAKEYTDNIIKSMIDTLLVVDPDARIKTINKATSHLLGYTEKELIGKPVGAILTEKDSIFKGLKLERLIEEGTIRDYAMKYRTKKGENIPVSLSGSVMRDKDRNLVGIIGIARDMREIKRLMEKEKELAAATAAAETEKKRVAELDNACKELRETQAKLIQAGKLAAMGTLGAGLAHQLNQPLGGIRLFAQILESQIDKNSPLWKDLYQIIEQVEYMTDIIDNIQGFARASEIRKEPIDINEPIEKSLQLVSVQLKAHKIVLLKNLAPGLPKVNADINQMQQIFLNFMTNAREAMDSMPEKAIKELRITTRLQSIDQRPKTKNNFVEIILQDTGPGIPEDIKDRIFDPFFTTKSPSNTGLGLSLSYGIIQDHGGTIEVDSRQGKGTTFIVSLPAC